MQIRSEHVTGFAVGIGAAAAGFYWYKKNQPAVDEFLRTHGIDLPSGGGSDRAAMTLEQLVFEKEALEDLIAEREYAMAQEQTVDEPQPAPQPAPAKPRKKTAAKKATS